MSAKGEVLGEAYETDSGLAVNLSVSDPFEVPSLDEMGFVFYFGDVPEGKAFDVLATMWSSNQEDQQDRRGPIERLGTEGFETHVAAAPLDLRLQRRLGQHILGQQYRTGPEHG